MICCNKPCVLGWPKSEYADSFGFILERNFFSSKRDKEGGGTGTKTKVWFLGFVLIVVKMISIAQKQNFAHQLN